MLTSHHLSLTVAHSVQGKSPICQGRDPWARNQSGHHGPYALMVMLCDASWSPVGHKQHPLRSEQRLYRQNPAKRKAEHSKTLSAQSEAPGSKNGIMSRQRHPQGSAKTTPGGSADTWIVENAVHLETYQSSLFSYARPCTDSAYHNFKKWVMARLQTPFTLVRTLREELQILTGPCLRPIAWEAGCPVFFGVIVLCCDRLLMWTGISVDHCGSQTVQSQELSDVVVLQGFVGHQVSCNIRPSA